MRAHTHTCKHTCISGPSNGRKSLWSNRERKDHYNQQNNSASALCSVLLQFVTMLAPLRMTHHIHCILQTALYRWFVTVMQQHCKFLLQHYFGGCVVWSRQLSLHCSELGMIANNGEDSVLCACVFVCNASGYFLFFLFFMFWLLTMLLYLYTDDCLCQNTALCRVNLNCF